MSTELAHLAVEFRFKPITTADGGAQVIDSQFGRNTPERSKGVLSPSDALLGRLSPEHFAITLARTTRDDTEEMTSTAFAVLVDHPGTLTEIDLGFLAGLTLPTAERKLLAGAAAVDEAFDRRVAPAKGVACDQILIDPLSREALLDSQGDLGQVNLAETAATSAGADGRNGWF